MNDKDWAYSPNGRNPLTISFTNNWCISSDDWFHFFAFHWICWPIDQVHGPLVSIKYMCNIIIWAMVIIMKVWLLLVCLIFNKFISIIFGTIIMALIPELSLLRFFLCYCVIFRTVFRFVPFHHCITLRHPSLAHLTGFSNSLTNHLKCTLSRTMCIT